MILILFGVSGVGKTTIGRLLSKRLGWRFEDGDDYHSPENRHKMQAGIPLTDEDRTPWLNVLHQRIEELIGQRENAILACSALKQKYRDRLVVGLKADQFRFALLDVPRDLLRERIRKRHHPYMNPNLMDSQLAALEVPADAWRISVCGTPEEAVEELREKLKAEETASQRP
ncbi:MAG TPA: gluconokinase, GntK/IdnK-type [Terriglobales bacterium]|nr:gluconokinase, GntK/IdnK-type [Terriglobales bacterium]